MEIGSYLPKFNKHNEKKILIFLLIKNESKLNLPFLGNTELNDLHAVSTFSHASRVSTRDSIDSYSQKVHIFDLHHADIHTFLLYCTNTP